MPRISIQGFRWVTAAIIALVLSSCATTGSSNDGARQNLITSEEIAASRAPNLQVLIERLRPRWLQSRGRLSINLPSTILVYQDDMQLGGVEVLARITTDDVIGIKMLTGSEAGMLPGAGSVHVERAIVVQMRREGRN